MAIRPYKVIGKGRAAPTAPSGRTQGTSAAGSTRSVSFSEDTSRIFRLGDVTDTVIHDIIA